MNLSEKRRSLLVFATICIFIVGMFGIILYNRDNISVASNASLDNPSGECTHQSVNYTIDVYPTCTSSGSKSGYCNNCGKLISNTVINPTGHSWTGPTCTNSQVCTSCGATGAPATGHSYAAATCTAPKTCTTCGATSGSALGHDWVAATCTEPKKCTRCNTTSGSPTGHSWTAATCVLPQRCANGCGATTGSALGHNYEAATCTEPKKCTRCDTKVLGSELGHDWSGWTQNGIQGHRKTCNRSGCNAVQNESHTAGADATCTTAQTCTVCNYVLKATLSHKFIYDGTKQPSGSVHYTKCSVCGTAGTASHNMSDPTCETPAKCSVCNYTSGASLGGHKWVYDGTKQPSGSVHYTKCSVCGTAGTASHNMSNPTCENPAKCSVCNYTSGASLGGHKWVYDGTKQPSGSVHYTKCSVCGTAGTASHNMSNPTCETPAKCSVCNYTSGASLGGHKWVYDGTKQPSGSVHYTKCSVCGIAGTASHNMSNPTCEKPATCSVCKWTNGTVLEHTWLCTKINNTYHSKKCNKCGIAGPNEQHTWRNNECIYCEAVGTSAGGDSGNSGSEGNGGGGTTVPGQPCQHDYSIVKFDKTEHWKICSKCEEEQANSRGKHTLSEKASNNGDGTHTFNCTYEGCEYKKIEAHIWGEDGKCTKCDAVKNTECKHDYSIVKHDDDNHWKICSKCESKDETSIAKHTFGKAKNDGGTSGTHSFTCTYEGCGSKKHEAHKFGSDGKCTVADCDAVKNTECEHDYSEVGNDNTNHWTKCKKCGEIKEGTEKPHTLGKYKNNGDGTHTANCTYEGCKYSDTKAHSFGEDGNCTASGCDATSCKDGKHDYSKVGWDNNNHYKKCKWCDGMDSNSVKPHTLGEWKTNADGSKEAECTFEGCGYVKKEEQQNNNSGNNDEDNTGSDDGNNDGSNTGSNTGNNDGNNNGNNDVNNTGNNDENNGGNNTGSNSGNNPNTQKPGTIPYAGNKTIVGVIAVVAVLGIVSFIKFKRTY